MNNEIKEFETYLALARRFDATAMDKVLFCIFRGTNTPREIMDALRVTKGNLANYCKTLVVHGKIAREQSHGRNIFYTITANGEKEIKRILS